MKLKITLTALAASIVGLPTLAQDIPSTELNVVGSIGVLSMYKDMELPFWSETIVESSGGAVKANLEAVQRAGCSKVVSHLHVYPTARCRWRIRFWPILLARSR